MTWEVPVAAFAGFGLLALMILPAGQSVAAWANTGAFAWPRGSGPLMQSIGGLLAGHPGRGVPTNSADKPPVIVVYSAIALGELLLITATAWAIALWWRQFGPGALPGMASPAEAETVLGLSNLTRRQKLIRPDLEPTDWKLDLP